MSIAVLVSLAPALAELPYLPRGKGALISILGGLSMLFVSFFWSLMGRPTPLPASARQAQGRPAPARPRRGRTAPSSAADGAQGGGGDRSGEHGAGGRGVGGSGAGSSHPGSIHAHGGAHAGPYGNLLHAFEAPTGAQAARETTHGAPWTAATGAGRTPAAAGPTRVVLRPRQPLPTLSRGLWKRSVLERAVRARVGRTKLLHAAQDRLVLVVGSCRSCRRRRAAVVGCLAERSGIAQAVERLHPGARVTEVACRAWGQGACAFEVQGGS